MARLTDLQRILLAAAAARDGGSLRPLPASAADDERTSKAIAQLVARGLAAERETQQPGDVHRRDDDARLGVCITDSGYAAIGIEPEDAGSDDAGDGGAVTPPSPSPSASAAAPRSSKQELVLGLLARDGGATMAELVEATSWLPHSTRAVLTGLRKKGHAINRGKRDEVTCYTIVAAA